MKKLHVNSIDKFARATDHIKEIQAQVSRLMDKGFAYSVEEDGIYFDLSKDKDYGKLSGRKYQEAEDAVSRIDDGGNKRNKGDFCLWKKSKKNEPSWQDPWFNGGRPGWHIEDTAISEKYLGEQYDIHGGARDLIFPHHEAEIAQQESASGKKPFVRYWMHTGFLNVKGQKMAKSLSNFITIRDALSKYDAKVLRFFFISGHYRSPIDFSEELLKQAKNGLDRLNEFLIKAKNGNKDDIDLIEKSRKKFIYNMDDDFDTVKALASIFDFVKDANKKGAGKKSYKFMKEIDTIFNVFDDGDIKIPSRVEKLVEDREIARNAKNFKRADELRQIIKKEGYVLDDTAKGTLIKKV